MTYRLIVGAALALAAAAASATTVELVFDVTASEITVTDSLRGAFDDVRPIELSFPVTISFHLEYHSSLVYMEPGGPPTAWFDFWGDRYISTSQWTEAFSGVPLGNDNPYVDITLDRTLDVETGLTNVITSFDNFTMWVSLDGKGNVVEHTGSRIISWEQSSDAFNLETWAPITDVEFISLLNSRIGLVVEDGYKEQSHTLKSYGVQTPFPTSQQKGFSVAGDVVLRSVSVVPEPSTYALTGLGLAAIAARRRIRRNI